MAQEMRSHKYVHVRLETEEKKLHVMKEVRVVLRCVSGYHFRDRDHLLLHLLSNNKAILG